MLIDHGHPILAGVLGVVAGLVLAWLLRPWTSLPPISVIGLAVLTSVLSVLIAYRFAEDPVLPAWWWLAVTGLGLALIDVSYHRLPHTWVLAMAAGGLTVFVSRAITEPASTGLVRSLLAALAVFAGGLVLFLAVPGWMGFGDLTTATVLALYWGQVGWPAVLLGVIASTLLLGVVAAQVWVRTRDHSSRLAAGPSLILGGWISILTHTS
ncbi:prepilin peptidase [Saccharopolyspora hirsuta]|nr:prepilin peptidase [Saccharopolyspora hirsuta]